MAERLDDMEVVFGSERIVSKEHLALAQASQTIQGYGFADALVDHSTPIIHATGRHDSISVNHKSGELTISVSGDTNQAANSREASPTSY